MVWFLSHYFLLFIHQIHLGQGIGGEVEMKSREARIGM